MGKSYETTVGVALPPEQAEAALYAALVAAGVQGVNGGRGVLRGAYPTTWASWGEVVQATTGHGPQGAVVGVRSECAMSTTLVDWGKNRKNVDRILAALAERAPVVAGAPAG